MGGRVPASQTIGLVAGADDATWAIARRLNERSFRVLWHTGERHAAGEARSLEFAATPTDIAFECRVVLTQVEDSDAFRRLVIGTPDRAGLGAEMNPGSVLVDLGIRPPRECQAILGLVGTRGVGVVDAAVIADAAAIARGGALVLAGGYSDAVELALPVLEAIGQIERTGPLGSAHTAAALMGYVEAAHVIARDQAMGVAATLGLAGDTFARVLDGEADTTGRGTNVVHLKRRVDLARRLAAERGISAEIIDLTSAILGQRQPDKS